MSLFLLLFLYHITFCLFRSHLHIFCFFIILFYLFFFFYLYGDHRYLHVLTPSFPTRRSSDLSLWLTLQNSRYDQATTSPCRLLPKLTLSPAATGVSGSVTDASLMRIAPSATLRFTSLLEDAKPRPVSACITVMPGPANVTVGRLASLAPSSKVRRAVSAAICAASVPRHSAVASLARTFLASLISLPCNEESRAIPSTGKDRKSTRLNSSHKC